MWITCPYYNLLLLFIWLLYNSYFRRWNFFKSHLYFRDRGLNKKCNRTQYNVRRYLNSYFIRIYYAVQLFSFYTFFLILFDKKLKFYIRVINKFIINKFIINKSLLMYIYKINKNNNKNKIKINKLQLDYKF